MEDRIIREPERARVTGISRTAWWEGERAGRYPRRRRIGRVAIGWLESELLAFLRGAPVVDGPWKTGTLTVAPASPVAQEPATVSAGPRRIARRSTSTRGGRHRRKSE